VTLTARRYPTRDAWLGARRIGSSDVATILGVGPSDEDEPRHSEWDVLMRLRGEIRRDRPTTSTERGVVLEPRVLRAYARRTGRAVRPTPPHTLYTRDEWASATPDARDDLGVVEAKTDRHRWRWGPEETIERWEPAAAEIVRPDYYLQVAHQLFVLDVQVGHLAVLLPGDDPFIPELRVYRIVRDRELEEALVDRLATWWDEHVVRRRNPEVDGSRAAGRYLAGRYAGGETAANQQQTALAAAYETARINAKQWEEARQLLGQQLIISANLLHRLRLPGGGKVTIVRQPGRMHLDERALLADHPEVATLLDSYRRPSDPYVYPKVSGVTNG
jgi:predicted phage-related endonuclease